jgi:hypothetical protein
VVNGKSCHFWCSPFLIFAFSIPQTGCAVKHFLQKKQEIFCLSFVTFL